MNKYVLEVIASQLCNVARNVPGRLVLLSMFILPLVACSGDSGSQEPPQLPGLSYTVGGTVSGLEGRDLILQNNAGDDLEITVDGTFTFAMSLSDGENYAVTIQTQPINQSQTCTVSNNTGTILTSDVTNITITCSTNSYLVQGTVSGMTGNATI